MDLKERQQEVLTQLQPKLRELGLQQSCDQHH
jgi:hypothetical protein